MTVKLTCQCGYEAKDQQDLFQHQHGFGAYCMYPENDYYEDYYTGDDLWN